MCVSNVSPVTNDGILFPFSCVIFACRDTGCCKMEKIVRERSSVFVLYLSSNVKSHDFRLEPSESTKMNKLNVLKLCHTMYDNSEYSLLIWPWVCGLLTGFFLFFNVIHQNKTAFRIAACQFDMTTSAPFILNE